MTPGSDNKANHSGSRCHLNGPNDTEPEQLHKEPESASPSGLGRVSLAATESKTATTTTSTDLVGLATNNNNNNNNKRVKNKNMKLRLSSRVEADDDDDGDDHTLELTSLFAHLDQAKVAPVIQIDEKRNAAISRHRQEVDRKRPVNCVDRDAQTMLRDSASSVTPSESPVGSSIGASYLRACSSSGASSLQGGELMGGEHLNQLDRQVPSESAKRATPLAADFERRQTTNNTIFIIQHLAQKRNELRSIDRKLFDIMTQYLVQLDLFPEQSKKFARLQQEGADDETTTQSHLLDSELEVEPQIFRENRLAWRHQKQQQHPYATTINLGSSWPGLRPPPPPPPSVDDFHSVTNTGGQHQKQQQRNLNELAMDLSLEGSKCRRSKSSGQSILLPPLSSSSGSSLCQDSLRANHDSSKNGITGTTSLNEFDRQQQQQQLISSNNQTNPQFNSAIANIDNINDNTNIDTNTSQATPRKQFTVNLKKSRLLGANLYLNVASTTDGQPKISPTTTDTQRCFKYHLNNNDDDEAELMQTHPHHQASPLNLLKRYRTPSPAATSKTITTSTTMSTAKTTSPPPADDARKGARQIILSPIMTPAIPVISSNQPMHLNEESPPPPQERMPLPEAPLAKKFRSVAQLVGTSDQQQVLASTDHYGSSMSRQHSVNDGTMALWQQNSSETLNYDGSLKKIVKQAHHHHHHHHSTAFDYSLHQHHYYNQLQSTSAADLNENHPSLAKQSTGDGGFHNYSLVSSDQNIYFNSSRSSSSSKQLAPIVCPVAADQVGCYIFGQHQNVIQHPESPSGQMAMMMMRPPLMSHLNDINNTNTCNAAMNAAAAARVSPRETIELMRGLDKDQLQQYNYLLPGAQQLSLQPSLAPQQPYQRMQHQSHQHQHQHLQRDFNQKIATYRCHVCGSSFEDRHRLQQHLSIHLNLHPGWFEETTIKETMARYESKRGDYLCSSCNQRFETTAEFDRHMHLHGDKPHQCELCNQDNKLVSFRYYRQLLTHLRSHCFLYSCRFVPDCKQTANRKDYLKLHILKHHLNNKLPEQYTVCCH